MLLLSWQENDDNFYLQVVKELVLFFPCINNVTNRGQGYIFPEDMFHKRGQIVLLLLHPVIFVVKFTSWTIADWWEAKYGGSPFFNELVQL